jgi:hypothetical protein
MSLRHLQNEIFHVTAAVATMKAGDKALSEITAQTSVRRPPHPRHSRPRQSIASGIVALL